jgi:hypothetical protein
MYLYGSWTQGNALSQDCLRAYSASASQMISGRSSGATPVRATSTYKLYLGFLKHRYTRKGGESQYFLIGYFYLPPADHILTSQVHFLSLSDGLGHSIHLYRARSSSTYSWSPNISLLLINACAWFGVGNDWGDGGFDSRHKVIMQLHHDYKRLHMQQAKASGGAFLSIWYTKGT